MSYYRIKLSKADTDFSPKLKIKIKSWIVDIIESEGFEIDTVNYIFCSDEYLLDLNKKYLDHDYYTDIMTFNNSDNDNVISSDIYISVDRVKENAIKLRNDFWDELHRVMIHGVLHLIGYNDSTDEEKEQMRAKEEECLERRIGRTTSKKEKRQAFIEDINN